MTFMKAAVNRLVITLFTSIVAIALIVGPSFIAGTRIAGAETAPNFELPDLNGSKVALSTFKGKKPVLVYFWATWCPHCVAVRPEVIKLRKGTAESDLAILAVNVGGMDSLARVKKFEEANPAPLTVLYDAGGKTAHSFGVLGIPHFILVDKNGTIKYSGNEMPPSPLALLK